MIFTLMLTLTKGGRLVDAKKRNLGILDFEEKKQQYQGLQIEGMPDCIEALACNPSITVPYEFASQANGVFNRNNHATVELHKKPREKFYKEEWIYMEGKLSAKFVIDEQAILEFWKANEFKLEI